jgi:hypothetical protein
MTIDRVEYGTSGVTLVDAIIFGESGRTLTVPSADAEANWFNQYEPSTYCMSMYDMSVFCSIGQKCKR